MRLKQVKKDQKNDVAAFEQQSQKLHQEHREQEKTWSAKEKNFSEEAAEMIADLWKLKGVVEDQRKDNEQLSTELTKKNNGIAELQTQLSRVKTAERAYRRSK